MKRWNLIAVVLVIISCASLLAIGCSGSPQAQSPSGVPIAEVGKMTLNAEGHTVEQQNIIDRLKADNDPGTVKHLYVISAYSGQVIIYSPVRGKVTSGGKRLTPNQIRTVDTIQLPTIKVGNRSYYSDALPSEDGTYGPSSGDYVYWFTPAGVFHQHFLSGGQIVHISDQPVTVKNVIITIEDKK